MRPHLHCSLIAAGLLASQASAQTCPIASDINQVPVVQSSSPDGQNPAGPSFFKAGIDWFFKASSGLDANANEYELYATNLGPGGTRLVKDINPTGHSNPTQFYVLGDQVFVHG